ncbi:MAG: rod shape-determining protein MreD [Jaaginema sp. PMC 1079.18]|nr:rod shape-determining protein MreD [Jaaginema sp. PMC 1080.18]MEC4851085.1 rod shape-determining protein MreD [Jaaginema sp. PMC 1079.18]MEC4867033.1 rod shape-determining protein MreD [Jaaginema sp. PMC 1078.18]
MKVSDLSPPLRSLLNVAIAVGSVLICLLMLPTRLPGTELLGMRPDWLLIWVVAWSVKRSPFQGAMAGLVLGLLWDSLSANTPSHAVSLAIVGFLTASFQKQRYLQEDFVSVALIVLGMSLLSETITALQYIFHGWRSLATIWSDRQHLVLITALLSSLWTPVLYYPLSRWWEYYNSLDQA